MSASEPTYTSSKRAVLGVVGHAGYWNRTWGETSGSADCSLHVTCVSEATVAAVRRNDEGTYRRLRAAQAEERRRQEAAKAAEEAAQVRGSIRSFFSARGGSGSNGASGSGGGGA